MATNPPPKADPATAQTLASKGFKVLPLTEYRKHPIIKGWPKLSPSEAHDKLRSTLGATGWCIDLRPSDPTSLLVIDVDRPGTSPEAFWRVLDGGITPLPSGVGIVRSTSGGIHLWFRTPVGYESRQPRESIKVGGEGGYPCDIRCSARGGVVLNLAGTVAKNKKGELGAYTWESPLIDPALLPPLPEHVWQQIANTPPPGGAGKNGPGMPTEIHDLLGEFFCHLPDGCIPDGTFTQRAYDLGRVMGRIWMRQSPPRAFLERMVELGRRLCATDGQSEFSPSTWEHHFARGWTKGWENIKGQAVVMPSDARKLAETIFGSKIRLQINRERHQIKSNVLEAGGKVEEVGNIKDPIFVKGLLCQMTGTDIDTLVQSPLNSKRYWDAFIQCLSAEAKHSKILSDDVDEFQDCLRQCVRDAADAGLISATASGGQAKKPDGTGIDPYKPWLQLVKGDLTLYVPTKAMERLTQQFSGATQKYLEEIGFRKKYGIHAWVIPIQPPIDEEDGALTKLVAARDLEHRQAKR